MDNIDKRIQELEVELLNSIGGSQEAKGIVDELQRLHEMDLKDKNSKKRNRIQILRVLLDGFKFIGAIAGSLAAIILIATLEEKGILGMKLLSIATKILPKVI